MNFKSEINHLQKQLLTRLNVNKGSTMFTIIEAITRQAYAKSSFEVSQKNATLAHKCKVTASTISRNLKKLKEKCADLITIEQNRNCEEKFAALVFTFQCQTETSNGEQTEPNDITNEPNELAEVPSNLSFKTYDLVNFKNTNKDLETNIYVKQNVDKSDKIYDLYIEFKKKGVNKSTFFKILEQVKKKKHVKNLIGYFRGALKNVVNYISDNSRVDEYEDFYNIEQEENQTVYSNRMNIIKYDWLNI